MDLNLKSAQFVGTAIGVIACSAIVSTSHMGPAIWFIIGAAIGWVCRSMRNDPR